MSNAVMAGSFDPLTKGHQFILEKASRLFGELTIAVGYNPNKPGGLFSFEERVEIIEKSVQTMSNKGRLGECRIVVKALPSDVFLVDFAEEQKAEFIIKGLRNTFDFEDEHGQQIINSDIAPHITTIFLMPPVDKVAISSSMVKKIVGLKQWETRLRPYVEDFIIDRLKEKHAK